MELTICTLLCYPRPSQHLNSLYGILDYETVQFHDYNVLQEPATSTYRVDENDEVPLFNCASHHEDIQGRWIWMVYLYVREESLVSIGLEAGFIPQPVWTY